MISIRIHAETFESYPLTTLATRLMSNVEAEIGLFHNIQNLLLSEISDFRRIMVEVELF